MAENGVADAAAHKGATDASLLVQRPEIFIVFIASEDVAFWDGLEIRAIRICVVFGDVYRVKCAAFRLENRAVQLANS